MPSKREDLSTLLKDKYQSLFQKDQTAKEKINSLHRELVTFLGCSKDQITLTCKDSSSGAYQCTISLIIPFEDEDNNIRNYEYDGLFFLKDAFTGEISFKGKTFTTKEDLINSIYESIKVEISQMNYFQLKENHIEFG